MRIDFSANRWSMNDFDQITSLRTDGRTPFIQEADCVVNEKSEADSRMKNAYVSILSKEWFSAPVTLSATCNFLSFGAPLLVLTDNVIAAPDGYPAYGRHIEIVAYEDGINVWLLNGTEKPILAGKTRFPVPANEKITLTAEILPGRIECTLCGQSAAFDIEQVPLRFRAGITACEGVNRFYSFSAD